MSLPDLKPQMETCGAPIVVEPAGPEDAPLWDNFVESHPEGRYCHLWGYRRTLEEAYGYHCVYLKFLGSGQLVGVFPSIQVRRRRWLISQPFNEYGGPLTLSLSCEQYGQLTRLLLREAQREGCESIEIRGGIGCEAAGRAASWKFQPLHSYALLRLGDPEHLWKKVVSYEARKGVNKARKAGLVAEVRRGARAVEQPFYHLYLMSMKRLGVPPHPWRFFLELAAGIGDRLVASWVMEGKQPVAILLGATSGRRVHIFVIASEPRAWPMRPSDLAHWELIEWACRQHLEVFDFGSARYSGQIQFKKKWGIEFHDYGYYLLGSAESTGKLKSGTVRTSSKSMAAMATLWKWVMPLALTRRIGPPIRKYLTK
ncbi:MAG: GNAT family N-acetyltransferase [Acidobacteriia bacterium]|nr:GNAT family N-acetyltransferase [Terriglobia bacterium]